MNDITAIQVKITGRVQGVFFRSETRKAALSHHLSGHVRNMPDGSVQALFQGRGKDIQGMLDWCRQGPPLSRVDGVIPEPAAVAPDLEGFHIRY